MMSYLKVKLLDII